MNAKTSDKVSGIAAKYWGITPDELLALTATQELRLKTTSDINSMAASLIRQDEVKGVRKLKRKVLRLVGFEDSSFV